MRKITIVMLIVAFFVPLIGSAQEAQPVQTTQGIQNLNPSSLLPIKDIENFLNNAKGSVPLLNALQEPQNVSAQTPANGSIPSISSFDLSALKQAWDSANAWSEAHLGVSLTEIATTIMNFMIWIWGLIWKLLQLVFSQIKFA